MEYSLALTFLTTNGEKATLTISDVKQNITGVQAAALMDTIIEKNIFFCKNGSYVAKSSAQLTSREVNKLTI